MVFRIESLKYQKNKYVRNEARRMFNELLGTHQGENFKKSISLIELVDSKVNNSDLRFQLYVGFIDNIIEYCKILFNIDLSHSGITMEWTAQQIIDEIEKIYMNE